MNRKERKSMEKQLGIAKHKKNMTRDQRFEIMRENIIHGNELQRQMKETVRVQSQKKVDEDSAARISFITTDLMINKGVPYAEAIEQAKELYKQEVEAQNLPKE